MIYSEVLENLSTIIRDSSIKRELEERFIPILCNRELISTITSLSKESPIFKKSLSKLCEAMKKHSDCSFVEEYENFYNNVMIISDELALIIKKEVDQIKEVYIPIIGTPSPEVISSRIFIGNSILFTITSNESVFSESLKVFRSAGVIETDK